MTKGGYMGRFGPFKTQPVKLAFYADWVNSFSKIYGFF